MSNRRSKRVLPTTQVKPAGIKADSKGVDSTFIFGDVIVKIKFWGLLEQGQLEYSGVPRFRSNLQPQHAQLYELEQNTKAPCSQELNLETAPIAQRTFHIEFESLYHLPAFFVKWSLAASTRLSRTMW